MVLTRTDLPAPLSPRRAVTWPAGTSRSTPASASTAPKCFLMPLKLRIGSTASVSVLTIAGVIPSRPEHDPFEPDHALDSLVFAMTENRFRHPLGRDLRGLALVGQVTRTELRGVDELVLDGGRG